MAVEHGMGSKERAEDFCPYITEVMFINDGLTANEIAAEIEDYMDTEFNTELQDESSIQVAEELLRFYNYCKEGDESTAMTEFEKLPPLQIWITARQTIKQVGNQSMAENNGDSSGSSTEEDEDMEVSEPGWTEVKTRRKR
ncbi:uncharacterized protein LOC107267473 isoform X2 [Cephus cinctus]|nr:uncharacterized protein LOC107267473 isoform X2 [Cephus cinctus]